jgi:hypothetical protein
MQGEPTGCTTGVVFPAFFLFALLAHVVPPSTTKLAESANLGVVNAWLIRCSLKSFSEGGFVGLGHGV